METEREKERVVFFSVLDEFLLSFFWGGEGGSVHQDFRLCIFWSKTIIVEFICIHTGKVIFVLYICEVEN